MNHRKFSRNNVEVFKLPGNMRMILFFAIFSDFWENFDEFRFAVRICCQTERQKLRVE